jgi:hypothetical protein
MKVGIIREVTMVTQPVLTDYEWSLILELLEAEQRELPSEIRHSMRSEIRDELRARLGTVRKLVEHLNEVVKPVAPMSKAAVS